MYLNFYQLDKKPFSLAPDPDFLYLSQQHKDALGAIIYGIKEREGFVSVVGEVGTGKTTIVRTYLQKTARNQVLPIFIFNSRVSFPELMKTFLCELGIDTSLVMKIKSLNEMVRLSYRAMIEKTKLGKTIVLIIDEAQNMPLETLGRLCVLSNFETAKAKLVQIVLVGQPELQKKLDRHELRQLRQRIAYKALITPLSEKDSVNYLQHRLSLSVRKESEVFTKGAVKRIVKYSKGVPRVINVLAENSLVAGYGLQKKPVSRKIVEQVIADYEGRKYFWKVQFKNVASGLLVALATITALFSLLAYLQINEDKALAVTFFENRPVYSQTFPTIEQDTVPTTASSKADDISTVKALMSSWRSFALVLDKENQGTQPDMFDEPLEKPEIAQVSPSVERIKPPAHFKIAKRGDTVSNLCLSTYGFVNTRLLSLIKGHNPHISNLDEIDVNEILLFPAIEHKEVISLHQHNNITLAAQERRGYQDD